MANETPEAPGRVALSTAGEFIKYFTALGTGALVFSAGLVSDKVTLWPTAQWLLTASWGLLALSIAGGVFAYARIPVQIAEQDYNLEDKWLTVPARVQQVAFFIGILTLAAALFSALTTPSVRTTDYKIGSALQAIESAMKSLPPTVSPLRAEKIEKLLGVEEFQPNARGWHVQFIVERAIQGKNAGGPKSSTVAGKRVESATPATSVDFFLDARTGQIVSVPNLSQVK